MQSKNEKAVNIRVVIGLACLIITIFLSLMYFNANVNSNLERMTKDHLRELTLQQQTAFDKELSAKINNLDSITKAMATFEYSDQTTMQYIQNVQSNFNFESVMITDIVGRGILASGEHINIFERPYFSTALNEEYTTSQPYISTYTEEHVIAVSAPIYYEGRVQGVIAAEYNLEYLNSLLGATINSHGYALIVNDEGKILMSTDTEKKENLSQYGIEYLDDDAQNTLSQNLQSHTADIITLLMQGERKIVSYRSLDFNDWTLMYIVPESVVTQNADEISQTMAYISAALIFVFVGVIIYESYSKQKHLKAIEKVAYYDELTGTRNLAKFKIDVAEVLSKNKNKRYYMVKGDIKNFKAVNEIYSFDEGNKVLQAIAKAGSMVPEHSFIQARIVADEYIMFAEEHFFADMLRTSELYEKMFKEILDFDDSHQFKFRLGRYLIEDNSMDVNEMITRTTMAHTLAKNTGEGLYCDYNEEFKDYILKITDITNRMETALVNEEFKVYLQPKNRVTDNKIVGAEALVRWIDNEGRMTFPGDFIPVFEENGFITELDKYMLQNVCKMLKNWEENNIPLIPISVNFSRVNLKNQNFAEDIKKIVQSYDVSPEFIEVEITETATSQNEEEFEKLMKDLGDSGIRMSIDDFGSGYSSLGMLKNFDVDTLKIDRSFFIDHKDDIRGNSVVSSVVDLAHTLNMYTVAEGVEDLEQIEFLKEIGCNAAQGYYYAKPMPIDEFVKLM